MVCLILMKTLMLLLAMTCEQSNFKIISLACIIFAFEIPDLRN